MGPEPSAQFELLHQRNELERAEVSALAARDELRENVERIAGLDQALSITRPALINQRCRALGNQLNPFVGLEMRFRLYPRYRWINFVRTSNPRDFESWAALEAAFDRWSKDTYQQDGFIRSTFSSIDEQIQSQIRDQIYWSQFTGDREKYALQGFRVEEPSKFQPRSGSFDNVRNIEDFISGYLRLEETEPGIRSLIEEENLERVDVYYSQFKEEVRRRVSPFLSGYLKYVDDREARQAKSEDDVVRVVVKQLMYNRNASNAKSALVGVCFEDRPLERLFFGVDL